MPDLDFAVQGAETVPYAAGPTLSFRLCVRNAVEGEQIHAVMLKAQVRIQATQRTYDAEAKDRLRELFGEPHQWGKTVKSLLWTQATVNVPGFTDSLVTELPIVCTYDLEVAGTKYLCALENGDVPLLFLFSGTVLYSREGSAVQVAQISWEKEAPYRMPIAVWKETIERYFPNSAWIRMRKDVFDRLYDFRAQNSLLTWDDTLERLMAGDAGKDR
jgi:hypothetical protein